MYKDILRSIANIELLPVIGLVIFFSFFVLMLIWVKMRSKNYVDHMANVPFEDGADDVKPDGERKNAAAI